MRRWTKNILGFLLMTSLWSSIAFAGGDEIGNGGHVVTCLSPRATLHYQSLDAYEARHVHGLKPKLIKSASDPFEIAARTFQRLAHLDPDRTSDYIEILGFLRLTHKFHEDFALSHVRDDESAPLPRNCYLQQAIIQFHRPLDSATFFLISQTLWSELDLDDRAILLMHEVVYWHAIKNNGHENSLASRRFNAAIFSDEITWMDQKTYQRFITLLRLNIGPLGE